MNWFIWTIVIAAALVLAVELLSGIGDAWLCRDIDFAQPQNDKYDLMMFRRPKEVVQAALRVGPPVRQWAVHLADGVERFWMEGKSRLHLAAYKGKTLCGLNWSDDAVAPHTSTKQRCGSCVYNAKRIGWPISDA